jgi:hypothetical protein
VGAGREARARECFTPLSAFIGGRRFATMMVAGGCTDSVAGTDGPIETEADLGAAVANAMAMAEQNGARLHVLTCVLLTWAELYAPKKTSGHTVSDFVTYFRQLSAPLVHQGTHASMWSLISKGLFRSASVARSHLAVFMIIQEGDYGALVNDSGRLCYDVIDLTRVFAYKGLPIEERGKRWVTESWKKLKVLTDVEMATLRSVPADAAALQITEVMDDQVHVCNFALCAMVCFL